MNLSIFSPLRWFRVIKILWTVGYYGLDELVVGLVPESGMARWHRRLFFWRKFSKPRGQRLRETLESLGPIFVKFGQMLSTRWDVLPLDIAKELALLQDQVPPFPSEDARRILEDTYGKPLTEVLPGFIDHPVASASVAQVHFANLPDGRHVAVKVLRPNIRKVIHGDIALMESAASFLQFVWPGGRRLHPKEVVAEFERHLNYELDLLHEAANASQLRNNFQNTHILRVPEIHWDWCRTNVMVMERMEGTPVGRVDELRAKGIDLARLAQQGVEIFFTQVFRDGYFHADMHPGNILVDDAGHYIALDFGIMGTLSEHDKNFLARIFLAFFRRDYRQVAKYHVDEGWAPADIRVDEFETEIRAVCEPIFDKPLGQISFAQLLVRLFNTSRHFHVEVQPQLVLLQKTLLNVEGLGRRLYPALDLWTTAKPLLERWMSQQMSLKGIWRQIKREAPLWVEILPQLPRIVRNRLTQNAAPVAPPPRASLWLVGWLAVNVIVFAALVVLLCFKL